MPIKYNLLKKNKTCWGTGQDPAYSCLLIIPLAKSNHMADSFSLQEQKIYCKVTQQMAKRYKEKTESKKATVCIRYTKEGIKLQMSSSIGSHKGNVFSEPVPRSRDKSSFQGLLSRLPLPSHRINHYSIHLKYHKLAFSASELHLNGIKQYLLSCVF